MELSVWRGFIAGIPMPGKRLIAGKRGVLLGDGPDSNEEDEVDRSLRLSPFAFVPIAVVVGPGVLVRLPEVELVASPEMLFCGISAALPGRDCSCCTTAANGSGRIGICTEAT